MDRHQREFFEMVDKCQERLPIFGDIWNRDEMTMDSELFESKLKLMSSGEAHLARFLAGIWKGRNTYDFDIFAAAAVLDKKWWKEIICNWTENRLFP